MHIKVDKTGQIRDIHIERWDYTAMPKGLENQINSFNGKPEKEFLIFAFTEKLFLYTKILYSSRDGKPSLWLWTNSVLGSPEDAEAMTTMARFFGSLKPYYAMFSYKSDEVRSDTKMIASEDFTKDFFQANGLSFELIEIPTQSIPMKQMFALFGMFNITRNGRNDVDYYDHRLHELIRSTASNHGYIVALGKDGRLHALSAVDVVTAPRDQFREYMSFMPTKPHDEEQANAINAAMQYISDIAREMKAEG